MKNINLSDALYIINSVDNGGLYISYSQTDTDKKDNKYIYSKNLETINIEAFDLKNLSYLRFDFLLPEDVSDDLDVSKEMDSILDFYNKINKKTNNDLAILITASDNPRLGYSINKEVMKKYDKFKLPGNVGICPSYENPSTQFVALDYIKEVDQAIELGINDIIHSNLSPLEKVMACYFVAQKLFNINARDNKVDPSEIIDDVYTGLIYDYITCAGYSNLFNFMLEKIDIKSELFRHHTHDSGHVSNIVIIKDEKYDIDGRFVFDATLDATFYYDVLRASSNVPNISYFSSIRFFGLGIKDLWYIPSAECYSERYNINEESINRDNLLTCLYNVYSFVYGTEVNKRILAHSFVHNMYARDVTNNPYMSPETLKANREILFSNTIEKLTNMKK